MSTRRNTLTNQIVINHAKKALEISKDFDKEASIFNSDCYNTLKAAKQDFPTYRVVVKSSSKKSLESKIKLKDILYYVEKHSGKDSTEWKALEELRGNSAKELKEKNKEGRIFEIEETASFFAIKKWFFETYPEIQDRVDKRKKRIEELVSGAA